MVCRKLSLALLWLPPAVGAIAVCSSASANDDELEQGATNVSPPGQGPAVVSLETSYLGFTGLSNPRQGTFEENLEVSMVRTSFRGQAPTPFKGGKVVIVNGLFFDQTQLVYRNWDFAVTPRSHQPRDFYAIGWEFALMAELKERLWLSARVRWGLFSDLEDVGRNDDRIYGTLLASFTFQNELTLGVGVSYNADLGFPAPLPLVQLSYRHRQFRIEMLLPSEGELLLTPHERVEIGFRGRLSGNEYHATNDANPLLDNYLVQISTLELGLATNFRVFRGAWFGVFGGGSLRNRYRVVQPNGELGFDVNVRGSWVVNGSLSYRL